MLGGIISYILIEKMTKKSENKVINNESEDQNFKNTIEK
jgi:hypothetical protein